jgi:hypothetical protein
MLWVSAQPRKARRTRRDIGKPKRWQGVDPATAFARIDKVAASESDREAIIGNTYPVKDQLRGLGGRWNPDLRAWMVPADKAEKARALVNGSLDHATCTPAYRIPITSDVTSQGIRPGDRIVIRYLDDNKTASLTLSNERHDPANGVLSTASPLGKQVIGLAEGDEAEFEVAGRSRGILIVSVEQ